MASEVIDLSVKIGGKAVPVAELFEIIVDQDLDHPDMAAVTLSNVRGDRTRDVSEGDPLVVEATVDGASRLLFRGEVTGLEPVFDSALPSRVTLRALNRLYRLARGRRTKTYERMTDQEIVAAICRDASLQARCDNEPRIRHDHVFQHNQTDLQFLRQRAARLDFEIRVDDSTLFFQKRKTEDSGLRVAWGGGLLERFRPRLSAAHQVAKVVCRGWDPVRKREIVGTASASPEMGSRSAPLGDVETCETDRPIFSQEEADAVARALLRERQMSYITGDAQLHGSPGVRAGVSLTIEVGDPKFSGKYYVTSCRHCYVHSVGGAGVVAHDDAGYRTLIQVRRDAHGDGGVS